MFDTVKYMFMAAAASGLLAACTSGTTDGDGPADGCAVKFEAREASRASVITNTSLTANPFVVYADMTKTFGSGNAVSVFDGTVVSYTDGAWSYGTLQYWFPGYTYSFVAVCPATLSDLNYENNRLALTYTQPADYTQAADVLTATHRRSYSQGTTAPVAFKFSHIMSRLNFVAQVDPAAEDGVMIQRLALVNGVTRATYQIEPAQLGSATETDDYILGTWTTDDQNTATIFERVESILLQPGEKLELFPTDTDPLIVIPQSVTSDLSVEISYHYASDPDNIITSSASLYSIAIANHGGKWDAARSYTYNFSLGANAFVIYSVPSVEDWKDAEGGNYVITDK